MAASDRPTSEINPGTQPTASDGEFQPAFEAELAELKQQYEALEARYQQVFADKAQVAQIQARKAEIQGQAELRAEAQRIEAQLRDLEVNLECRLSLPWTGMKQAFWQAVRFGGLGLVLGWGLAFAVMNGPQTSPPAQSEHR
jgi:hypothetical protein